MVEHFDVSMKTFHQIHLEHQTSLHQISILKSNLKTFSLSFRQHQVQFIEINERYRQTQIELLFVIRFYFTEILFSDFISSFRNEKEIYQHLKINYDQILSERDQLIIDVSEAKKKVSRLSLFVLLNQISFRLNNFYNSSKKIIKPIKIKFKMKFLF